MDANDEELADEWLPKIKIMRLNARVLLAKTIRFETIDRYFGYTCVRHASDFRSSL